MGNDGTKDDSIKDDATSREAPLSAVAVGNGEECEGFSPHAPIQPIQDESPLEKPKSLQTAAKKKLAKKPASKKTAAKKLAPKKSAPKQSEFIRAENEDDDGYDPYSDRRPEVEPLFERNPWM